MCSNNRILKNGMHSRSKHLERYNFGVLTRYSKNLSDYVHLNKYGSETIDFSDIKAVTALNQALVKCYYNLEFFEIPDGYLCPAVPGRADYIHHLSDLLFNTSQNERNKNNYIFGLDIGTGSSIIYPIIGNREYGWKFVGTDIDHGAIKSATRILEMNDRLSTFIEVRKQNHRDCVLLGIIYPDDFFHFSMCNPPFHASEEDARSGTIRKWKNLGMKSHDIPKSQLNFGGESHELYCMGGEISFLRKMIAESSRPEICCRVLWFTSLVSKESNLNSIYSALKQCRGVQECVTIQMSHGQKKSRIVAWTYFKKSDMFRAMEMKR